jgi:hypothetical protein
MGFYLLLSSTDLLRIEPRGAACLKGIGEETRGAEEARGREILSRICKTIILHQAKAGSKIEMSRGREKQFKQQRVSKISSFNLHYAILAGMSS